MKKIFILTTLITIVFTTNTIAQNIKWKNWASLEKSDGIELEYRFGHYTSYEGKQKTELQIKAYNTRNKKVMVNFKSVTFSTGKKDYGGHLFYPSENSYTFTFRTDGTATDFDTNWTVEYYTN
jgi:hypothetical protein